VATRSKVHSSPTNPCAVAPSSRACSTVASWASDSRGVGPLDPRLDKASVPPAFPGGVPDADGLGGDLELAGDLGLADAGATHEDLVANEEDAAATTQAILDVVASVRSQGTLVS
jgi:hypothetical protein